MNESLQYFHIWFFEHCISTNVSCFVFCFLFLSFAGLNSLFGGSVFLLVLCLWLFVVCCGLLWFVVVLVVWMLLFPKPAWTCTTTSNVHTHSRQKLNFGSKWTRHGRYRFLANIRFGHFGNMNPNNVVPVLRVTLQGGLGGLKGWKHHEHRPFDAATCWIGRGPG